MTNFKKIISGFFVLCLFTGLSFAQNVDDVIAKHIKAHGGEKNWEAVKSLKINGKFTAFSESKEFTTILARPNLYYKDFHMGSFPSKDGYNGKTAWTLGRSPRRANDIETNAIIHKAEFCSPFLNYKEKGYKVKLIGKEKLDGMDMFKIELIKKENYIETWYLNAKTYLEHVCTGPWEDNGFPTQHETFFDNFTKVGKIIIPFYVERDFGSRIRITEIDKIETNIKYDESIFNIPYSEEIKKLHFLKGKWSVKVESLGRSGFRVTDSTATSEIKFGDNASIVKETILYVGNYPMNVKNKLTYNAVTEQYRISNFDDLNSNMEILEGDFVEKDFVLTNKTISYGKNDENKPYRKFVYKDITRSGFTLEMHFSRDKGENWQVFRKITYSRKK